MAEVEAFATKEQMEARSLGEISLATHPFLEDELKAATRTIRNVAGWHIAAEAEITRRVFSRSRHEIWIPAREISAAFVTPDGGAEVEVPFDPATGETGWSGTAYTLRFTAGFTAVPADIVTACLQVAARALGAPLGFTQEHAGGVGVSHSLVAPGVAGGSLLLPHERDAIAAYIVGVLP